MVARPSGVFATPVVIDALPGAATVNARLAAAITTRMASDPGVKHSNIGGWQSATDMGVWAHREAEPLVHHVMAIVAENTTDIGAAGKPRFRWSPQLWANVNRAGASNQTHCHPGATWAAVYYVDDGYDGRSDPADGGELVLIDPRYPATMMNLPDLRLRTPEGVRYESEILIRPEAGRIVMFPGWLSHAVRVFNGPGTRISIAINIVAMPLPA